MIASDPKMYTVLGLGEGAGQLSKQGGKGSRRINQKNGANV